MSVKNAEAAAKQAEKKEARAKEAVEALAKAKVIVAPLLSDLLKDLDDKLAVMSNNELRALLRVMSLPVSAKNKGALIERIEAGWDKYKPTATEWNIKYGKTLI